MKPQLQRKRHPSATARSSPTYLLQTPYSYYFRIKVPDDLRLHFHGKTEIKRSLETGYLSEAKYKARVIAGQIQRLFRYLRTRGKDNLKMATKLTDDLLNDILTKFIQGHLDGFENEMTKERKRPLTDGELENKEYGYWFVGSESREALATGDYDFISDSADSILKKRGIKDLDTVDYRKLCRELLKSQVEVLGRLEKQVYGNYGHEGQGIVPGQAGTQATPTVPIRTDTLRQAVSDYRSEKMEDLKARTRHSYESYLSHILQYFGEQTQLHTIDYMTVKEFRDGLKSGELSSQGKPLSASRINNYLMILKNIYDLAILKDTQLTRNPAESLRLKDNKVRADQKQDVFSAKDLEIMFIKSKEYSKNRHIKPAYFWIPLLALYTGARLEELCQLLVSDVTEMDGLWCLDINESDAPDLKSVKTSEQRIVPLHPFIVDELRFVEFVKSVRPRGKNARVFPELKRVRKRWGHGLGQWFTKFKTGAGVKAPPRKKTFHSFRHTFINFHKQHGTDLKHLKEVVGHGGGGDITFGRYGKPFEPRILFDNVISKTDYGLDLNHLKKSKYVPR